MKFFAVPKKYRCFNTATIASLFFILSLAVVYTSAIPATASPIAVEQIKKPESISDKAFFVVDPKKSLKFPDIVAIDNGAYSNEAQADPAFSPVSSGIPIQAEGSLWLRFSIIKNPSIPVASPDVNDSAFAKPYADTVMLKLGANTPKARLWLPKNADSGKIQWTAYIPTQNQFPLTAPVTAPMTVYLYLESIPSLWFNPMLHPSGYSETQLIPFNMALILLLGTAILVCFLRGLAEKAQWRIWASLFLSMAFLQAIFPRTGMQIPITMASFIFLMAPGISVMLLPHLGRHMLQTHIKMRKTDLWMLMLTVPGIVLAILPLLPELGWTARITPLMPAVFLLALPIAIGGLLKNRPGSLAFVAACFFPILGVIASTLELFLGDILLGSTGGLWGFALGGIALAITPSIPVVIKKHKKKVEDKHQGQALVLALDDIASTTDGTSGLISAIPADVPVTMEEGVQEKPITAEEHSPCGQPDGKLGEKLIDGFSADSLMENAAKNNDTSIWQNSGWSISDPWIAGNDDVMPTKNETEPTSTFQTVTPFPGTPEEPAKHNFISEQLLTVQGEQILLQPATFTERTAEQKNSPNSEFQINNELSEQASIPRNIAKSESVLKLHTVSLPEKVIVIAPEAEDEQETLHSITANSLLSSISGNGAGLNHLALARVENALRTPYEAILRGIETLKNCPVTPEEHSQNLTEPMQSIASMLDNLDRIASGQIVRPEKDETVFSLYELVRETNARVIPLAESKGLSISWFISPLLPQFFKGHEEKLREAITLLLFDSVEATNTGSVQLSVRPDQHKQEYLSISISDNGKAGPPLNRLTTGIIRAWELAGSCDGTFSLEYTPHNGMMLVFSILLERIQSDVNEQTPQMAQENLKKIISLNKTLRHPIPGKIKFSPETTLEEKLFEPEANIAIPHIEIQNETSEVGMQQENSTLPYNKSIGIPEETPYVILSDMATSSRRLLNEHLEGLPHIRIESRTPQEVVDTYDMFPIGLVIIDADTPEVDLRWVFEEIDRISKEKNIGRAPAIALLSHSGQTERMVAMGFNEFINKPVERDVLRECVCRLLPLQEIGQVQESRIQVATDLESQSIEETLPVAPAKDSTEKPRKKIGTPQVNLVSSTVIQISKTQEQPAKNQAGNAISETITSVTESTLKQLEAQNINKNSTTGVTIITDAVTPTDTITYLDQKKDNSQKPVSGLVLSLAEDLAEDLAHKNKKKTSVPLMDLIITDHEDQEPEQTLSQSSNPPQLPDLSFSNTDSSNFKHSESLAITHNYVPLEIPGMENENMDPSMLPLLPGFLLFLEEVLGEITSAIQEKSLLMVQEGAERLAGRAEVFGLVVLERIAHCVSRAASANDLEAAQDLGQELHNVGTRYHESLLNYTQTHGKP